MSSNIENLRTICDGMYMILQPFGEVVLHDLSTEKIVYVIGATTNRKIGELSFLDVDLSNANSRVFGPYFKTSPDGRLHKTISMLISNENGAPEHLLCVNIDTSHMGNALSAIELFMDVSGQTPDNPFADDWHDRLNAYIAKWCMSNGLNNAKLTPADRRRLLKKMNDDGVFEKSKAADAVASALSVGRTTIYQDLKEIQ